MMQIDVVWSIDSVVFQVFKEGFFRYVNGYMSDTKVG
jgi:hypothetical protein